jgi:hypothetical protein
VSEEDAELLEEEEEELEEYLNLLRCFLPLLLEETRCFVPLPRTDFLIHSAEFS